MTKKIAIVGTHGVGKSKICERIKSKAYNDFFEKEKLKIHKDSSYGPTEIYYTFKNQFALIPEQFREVVKDIYRFEKQTEEITLATYAKQLYLENLYTAQGKNVLCDRSVLDTFIYYMYFNNTNCLAGKNHYLSQVYTYSKIYLIAPSDRPIEDEGFRMTDKKQQYEIHKLFLEYFKDFDNVEIVNQEEANKEEFTKKVAGLFY